MLNKSKILTPLILLITLLISACQPSSPPPPTPDITPASEEQLALGPQIRIANNTNFDLNTVTLDFGDFAITYHDIPSGQFSNYIGVDQAYQSIGIHIETAEGTGYTIEPFAEESAGERANPITAGIFTINLTFNNTLTYDWQPERSPALQSLLDTLDAANVPYTYQPSITRSTIFNDLIGENISFREILTINEDEPNNTGRLDVFIFPDATTAQTAASTIKYGGTEFEYTHPDGQTTSIIADFAMGTTIYYWHYENYILHTTDRTIAPAITAALQTPPLYDPDAGPPVQVAIANVSNQTYDNLAVTLHNGTIIGSGDVPPHTTLGFTPVDEAYSLASVSVTIGDETYDLQVIDYVGEEPLSSGRYIYAVDLHSTQPVLATIREDAPIIDNDLINKRWQWTSATPANSDSFEPAWIDQLPYLQFTTNPEPNGQGGYVMSGYSGCNGFGGSYFLSPRQELVIPPFAMTAQGCQEPIQQAEQFLTTFLHGVSYYGIDDDILTLSNFHGDTLTFTHVADPIPSGALKGYQIFSWQNPNSDEWQFAFLPGTNRLKQIEEIQVNPLTLAELLAELQTLEPRTELHWPDTQTADNLTSGDKGVFALPPQNIIDQVLETVHATDLPLSMGQFD